MANVTQTTESLQTADLSTDAGRADITAGFATCEKEFGLVYCAADQAFKAIATLHAQVSVTKIYLAHILTKTQVVELHAIRLSPLRQQLDLLDQGLQNELPEIAERFRLAKANVKTQESVVNDMQSSINSIQGRIHSNKKVSALSDVLVCSPRF